MDTKILKQRIIFRRLIQGLIILAIFVMAVTPIIRENDIYWQMRLGEDIVERHYFPVKDPYSLSAFGEVWTLHEWLPSVAFYLVNQHFGSAGLILFKAAIISLTFAVFMLLFNRLKANLYLSLLVFALAALVNTRGIWTVFPSIFEYLFLVLTLYLLEVYRAKPGKLVPAALGFLSLLWANSHGSFFLLPIIVAIYVAADSLVEWCKRRWPDYLPSGKPFDRRARQALLVVVGISLLTPLATPNGYMTYLYPFRITLGKFTPYVSEYQHFWVVWQGDWSDFVHGFAIILMVASGILFLVSWRRLHLVDLAIGLLFTILALTAVRHVAIFALVAVFLIAKYLGVYFGEYRGWFRRTLLKDILIILLILFVSFYYKTKIAGWGLGWSEAEFPKQAAELIMNNKVPGNMFNHYNYGGYLIWEMPGYKVFMDGRLEMYEGQAGIDYDTILLAKPGYKGLLDKYKINFFINYLNDPISQVLVDDPEWKYIYHDQQYVVFVKDTPENAAILTRYWSAEKQGVFREAYRTALGQFVADRLNKLGVTDAGKGNLRTAVADFEGALRYDPKSVSARLNLAQVLVALGMYPEAEKEYQYVLTQIDANNPVAKKGLATVAKLTKQKL